MLFVDWLVRREGRSPDKKLGKEKELVEFLQINIKWKKAHGKYHERNIPRLITEFAPPEFEMD